MANAIYSFANIVEKNTVAANPTMTATITISPKVIPRNSSILTFVFPGISLISRCPFRYCKLVKATFAQAAAPPLRLHIFHMPFAFIENIGFRTEQAAEDGY